MRVEVHYVEAGGGAQLSITTDTDVVIKVDVGNDYAAGEKDALPGARVRVRAAGVSAAMRGEELLDVVLDQRGRRRDA